MEYLTNRFLKTCKENGGGTPMMRLHYISSIIISKTCKAPNKIRQKIINILKVCTDEY